MKSNSDAPSPDVIAQNASLAPLSTSKTKHLLQDVPVLCQTLLDSFYIEAGKLSQIETGDVIVLRKDCFQELELRAGDRRLARARLVEVEGEPALCITEVLL